MVGRSITISLDRSAGFTLVELMMVIVILAVLTTIAVPSFRDFIIEQRTRSTMADLRIALMTARSEAVKRNRDVAVTAATGGWQNGWNIAHPTSGQPDILNHVQPGSGDVTISGSGGTIGFKASGRVEGDVAKKFVVTVGSGDSAVTKCLLLSASGQMDSIDKGDVGCPS